MSKEIEAQVLSIDYNRIIDQIKTMGGVLKFDWTKFRIAVFYPCLSTQEQNEKYDLIFTRVRDEGLGTVTITTKTRRKINSSKYSNEYEIETQSSFEDCKSLLLANHLEMKSYQEKLRQKWYIPSRPEIKEIVFDIWPGIPMYMEVEANTERDLMNFLTELNINPDSIRYAGASKIYNEILGITEKVINDQTPLLDFKTVAEQLANKVTDKAMLLKMVNDQKKLLTKIGFAEHTREGPTTKRGSKKRVLKRGSKKRTRKV